MTYFPEEQSAYAKFGAGVEDVLSAIAGRYIGEHGKQGPVYRLFSTEAFLREEDYRYVMDLDAKLEGLAEGQFVYCWSKLWSDKEADIPLSLSCFSPARVYVNGSQAFASNLNDDVFPDRRCWFRVRVSPGWNHIVLRFTKTATGCGGRFGTGSIKGAPLHFLVPLEERAGQEGWVYSGPFNEELKALPGGEAWEDASVEAEIVWSPKQQWTDLERASGVFARLFGKRPGAQAWAWTRIRSRGTAQEIRLSGSHQGDMTLLLGGREIYASSEPSADFAVTLRLPYGTHDLLLRSTCTGPLWGFDLGLHPAGNAAVLQPPRRIEGLREPWLYLGPFPAGQSPAAEDIPQLERPFADGAEGLFWQADLPGTYVRAYLETPLFGRWNYPLGVTLYGLLQTGVELGRPDTEQYVLDHIGQCTALHDYALWDKRQFGAPGINHQLVSIDSLDDCGSFGATMLVAMSRRELPGGRAAADRIARYITEVQDRQPDGALYRVHGSTDFMQDTMWCDDLYMSVPFLCRYAGLTGDGRYLDDAARQFLLYKKYMYMPELQIMSHVYDFKFGKPNGIPWGRGNGWVLFSLTELLAVLPENHPQRPELLGFFRDLSAGYLRLQGERGLWHQVLTNPESYEESSCTSMFVYAFARGVRYGWLEPAAAYTEAVLRGWEGLSRHAVDARGNVYGVCRGSGYSFSSSYYKDELLPLLNDTHGIGIVLLAGIETRRLAEHLRSSEPAPAPAPAYK
ncbi:MULTISPECIES: glycoside hydrolase family 88/105 protein [Paenibacillus]|uniref:glycoside hydrolase family 88/105 protein n=1 Tax=Paenibacillus TaxID=44249 RepID=UPI0022B8D138|nr:glycoside hydrolase family 88 protein [Paenibacillus caseinilyticus]MCZ8521110.1 glycoside hydrolase family 88 protein [Paenibacillus caseinilyticus]